jgi:hypothetical protein
MRLRGLTGARDEFHLAATAQNLKTLAKPRLAPAPKRATRLRCVREVASAGDTHRHQCSQARSVRMTCTATGEVSPIASLAAPIADFINSIGHLPTLRA